MVCGHFGIFFLFLLVVPGKSGNLVDQGCQILHTWNNIPKLPLNIPNVHKIYQIAVKYTICPLNTPTTSIARPSKICPN
jgi:hypothetical protein